MRTQRTRFRTALGLVILLMAPVGPVQARPDVAERTIEAPYVTPAIGAAIHVEGETSAYYYDCLNQIGCTIIPLRKGDRHATLEIEDSTGQAVLGSIYLTPGFGHVGYFCGRTTSPISIRGYTEILVHVISGVCPGGTPSLATNGVVRATLSGRR
jgi:hypothetical protein